MRHQYYWILLFAFLIIGCGNQPQKIDTIAIIPKPVKFVKKQGEFLFKNSISLTSNKQFLSVSNYLAKFLKDEAGVSIKSNIKSSTILFSVNQEIENDEGYRLLINTKEIRIEAKTEKGAFYAVQTLIQLFPTSIETKKPIAIPCIEIKDHPQFSYRGMHLDVGRHFYSVDFIKKYIDLISRLKMNTFHWHLTEDQGWRIEIKKYPKLQEVAAFRKETLIGHYSDQPHKFDGKRYGGFYTQEQIKEIVKYALDRQINIIPEIEMPGHSQAAIAAYPNLGCTGKQVDVATKWGVFEEVYCPSETTFKFLEDVIDEVVSLFPGKYIHIGGDEAPKTRWKNCKHCQKLIKQKGLKDEHGLQSYFIRRMEKYINSKGKQIIGWDEILEGGLVPNATVMSWRGTQGAVEAAKEKHNVILTPTSHCYFDYYQSDNENEPLAIGGFLPLEMVYNFNPIPQELQGKEESKYVLGAQGNVWTEYMPTSKQVEYMAFPRAAALSETVWSKTKNYSDFVKRLENLQKRWDVLNVNYANHLYEIKGKLNNQDGKLSYELKTVSNSYDIYYSLDNSTPSLLYKKPISIDSTTNIKAIVLDKNEKQLGNLFQQKINLHKAVGTKITIDKKPHPSYSAGGKEALINGISGNNKRYGDKEWLGFWGDDIQIEIDLKKFKEIKSISIRFHNGNGQWIYAPQYVGISLKMDDGRTMNKLGRVKDRESLTPIFKVNYEEVIANHIEITIKNFGVIPEGKQGAGNKAWTFIDEIIIE